MNTTDSPPQRSLFKIPPRLLTARTLWGIVTGAVAAVVICGAGGLLCWQLGVYGRALSAVWSLNWEAAAWRGALLGLLVGWHSRSFKQMLSVFGIGAAALLAYEWKYQLSQEISFTSVFDFSLILHYSLNAFLICAATYLALQKHDHAARQRRPATVTESTPVMPSVAEHNLPEDVTIEAQHQAPA